MATLQERYAKTLAKIEADRQSDAEVARLTGQTIEEFDADTTAPDRTDQGDQHAKEVAAYEAGHKAFRDGMRYSKNPYDYRRQPELSDNWCNGWLDAEALA